MVTSRTAGNLGRGLAVLTVWLLALAPLGLAAVGTVDCSIAEGAGIGGVRIGMPASAALAATGPPLRQAAAGDEVVYALRPPWSQMTAVHGLVYSVRVQGERCRTSRGVGPGSTLAQVLDAYAGASASTVQPGTPGDRLSYPFLGVAFLIRGGRVEAVEVFRVEGAQQRAVPVTTPTAAPAPGAASPTPSPSPTVAPGAWSVRSVTTRVEGSTLVLSGVVENRERTLVVYAEARLMDAAGRQVGEGNAPLHPSPVPVGKSASFVIRIPIDQVVSRYVVTIRPVGVPAAVLAQAAGEIKDLQQFAAMATRQVTVEVKTTTPLPSPNGFLVVVTNGSSLTLARVAVSVQISVVCRVASRDDAILAARGLGELAAAPVPTPGRQIQETWTGAVVATQISPRSSVQVPLTLSGGVCLTFLTWTASTQITDLKVAD